MKTEWLECEKEHFAKQRKEWIEKVINTNPFNIPANPTYGERFGYG